MYINQVGDKNQLSVTHFFNTATTPAIHVISFTDKELASGVIEASPDGAGLISSCMFKQEIVKRI